MILGRIMAARDIEKVFGRFKPWVTKFEIEGVSSGGYFDAMHDVRIDQFFRMFPKIETILELGSLEGGHTFALSARQGVKSVVGIEGRVQNVEKSRAVQRLLDIRNVEFLVENLESYDLRSAGAFDAVFCVGVLYHLPRPWDLIAQMAQVTRNLFLWTHYAPRDKADQVSGGYRGSVYGEFGLADPLSGMSEQSFWPTLDGLVEMLGKYGFAKIQTVENNPSHPNGPAIILAARAD